MCTTYIVLCSVSLPCILHHFTTFHCLALLCATLHSTTLNHPIVWRMMAMTFHYVKRICNQLILQIAVPGRHAYPQLPLSMVCNRPWFAESGRPPLCNAGVATVVCKNYTSLRETPLQLKLYGTLYHITQPYLRLHNIV